jgi:carbohydrate kinase (thermoresistant glucokinase family)
MARQPQAVVLMGVSGCGKTSVGVRLSRLLDWPFYDGDDYHPEENVTKMGLGIPLDDADRTPWLANLNDLISEHLSTGRSMLLACSALKEKYRDQLAKGNPGMVFVYLKGDFNLIFERMRVRSGHYMKAEMLQSQYDALEEPTDALVIDISQDLDRMTKEIISWLGLK